MGPERDVAIIGAGLLGLAAGRALSALGRDVVVLEQAEVGHDGAGSKGSCRIFRVGYPDPDYVVAARQARELWRELAAESGRTILWPTPQLTFGSGLRGVQDAMRAAAAPFELLPAAEAASRFPAIRVGGPALLEPDSAVIAADVALAALAARAGEIRTGVRVTSLADDGRRVTLQTSEGPLTARVAVVTAGPWSGGLLATAGLAAPTRPTLEQVGYLRPAAGVPADQIAPIFIGHSDPPGAAPYGLPVPSSSLYKIGLHPSGPVVDPDGQDETTDPELATRLAEVGARYLPGYEPDPVGFERCHYDNTPDEDFIVDRVGSVVIGCGTSGHGFKFGPLLGQWLAALATDLPGAPDPWLRGRFALGRFRAAR